MENNNELLKKAKAAQTPDELIELATKNGTEMTKESANAYFELLHPKTGELSDDELLNVSGGGCHKDDGRLVVTVGHGCTGWECKSCGGKCYKTDLGIYKCRACGKTANCNSCYWCSYEKGLWLCNKDSNKNH